MKANYLSLLLAILFLLPTCSRNDQLASEVAQEAVLQEDTTNCGPDFLLDKGAILGLRFGVYQNKVDKQECKNFLRQSFFPAWKGLFPGSEVFYLSSENGIHSDKEVFFWAFQNSDIHASYFPSNSFPSEAFEKRWEKIKWLYADSTLYKYFQSGWSRSPFATDYEVIASKKEVKQDWLQKDAYFIIESLELKPAIERDTFENFLSINWRQEESLDFKGAAFMLKVLGQKNKDRYAQLFAFENKEGAQSFVSQREEQEKLNDAEVKAQVISTSPELYDFVALNEEASSQLRILY